MDEEYFDVVARVPPGASRDDVSLMLQNLLAERFRLQLHRESKEMPGYSLVLGRGPLKLKASPEFTGEPWPALPSWLRCPAAMVSHV